MQYTFIHDERFHNNQVKALLEQVAKELINRKE
jgi:hypothetical protein